MAFGYQEDGGVGGGDDITYRKVFVGGLAWETQSHTLRRYFEQFGDILEAVVITDKNTRRSKGYGFVTFRDPFSAERACVNPTPIIDGRKANCNLAYFGQTRSPFTSSGRSRPAIPVAEGLQSTRGSYGGSLGHHQPPSYVYQPGFVYPPYGYITYGSGIVYPQGVYNPYLGQHYLQVYGTPAGTVNSGSYSHGQARLHLPGGHNHQTIPSYGMPSHSIMQFGGSNVNGVTAAAIPMIQSPYHTGTIPRIQSPYPTGIPASAPGQTQIAVPAHSPPMPSSSDHTES